MKTKTQATILPPRGYCKELAELAGCSTRTVISALRHNRAGVKAELVRKLFRTKYLNEKSKI